VDQQNELEIVQREEEEARLRLSEQRERVERSDGVAEEDHELLRQLEHEWKQLTERLRHLRGEHPGS
jgi:hypothetical protein